MREESTKNVTQCQREREVAITHRQHTTWQHKALVVVRKERKCCEMNAEITSFVRKNEREGGLDGRKVRQASEKKKKMIILVHFSVE